MSVTACDLSINVLRIILHPMTLPYNTALAYCEVDSLKLRRYNFQQKFFKQICQPGNCLLDLLPPGTWSFCFSPTAALPHPSGPKKTVLLLHKLLLKVLQVTTFYVRNSAVLFYFFTSICCTYCCLCFHVILTYIIVFVFARVLVLFLFCILYFVFHM